MRTAQGGPIKTCILILYILKSNTCFCRPRGQRSAEKYAIASDFDVLLMGHGEIQVSMLQRLDSEHNNFHLFPNLLYTMRMLQN